MKKQLMNAAAVAALFLAVQTASSAAPGAADPGLNWPSMSGVTLKTGTFVNVDNLRQVAPGVSKDQLYDLLGRPHFTTGLFGVREWDYLFNFRTGRGEEYVSCQFKVLFDGGYRAQGLYWRDPACAQYLARPAPVVQQVMAPSPPPAPAPQLPRKISLSADGLFRFAGGTLADLHPDGRARIEALAADIQHSGARAVRSMTISGHTDWIGSLDDNMQLSLQRAQTVRDLLVQRGIPFNMVRVTGFGPQQPVVQCAGAKVTPALVNCLQPNRRVEIEFNGE